MSSNSVTHIANSFECVTVGERFIVRERQHRGGDAFVHFYADLRACNLLWSYTRLDKLLSEKLVHLAGESGTTVSMNYLDTASLVQVLENAHLIGPNYSVFTSDMAPLVQLIHETTFNKDMRTEYIDEDTSLPYVDAVRAVTRNILPIGVLAYDSEALTRNDTSRRFQSLLLRNGYVNN